MGQDPSLAGNIRIGNRERDAVAAVLQEAAGDGRLSMAELDDRLDAALQAKTYGDLDPLVADLSVELPSHALSSGRPRAQGPPSPGYSREDPLRLEAGIGVTLRSPSSAATGSVRVYDCDGVQVQLAVNNLFPGQYRIAFHETPELPLSQSLLGGTAVGAARCCQACGRSLAGLPRQQRGQPDRLRGVCPGRAHRREPSLRGRSVVIHWGTSVGEAFPGQPNNRIACGVLRMVRGRFLGGVQMGFLSERRILVTGVLSNRSIAYGVARACAREGASLAFTYVNDDLKDRVAKLAAEFGPVAGAAVRRRARRRDRRAVRRRCAREWGGLDGLLHSIAFAPREALAGDFLERLSRAAFAHRARHLELQLRGARQGRAAADAGPHGVAA